MRFELKHSLVLLSCTLSTFLFGQNREEIKNSVIQQRIEFLAEEAESENIDFTTLTDDLSYYYDYPINLNNTDREELERLNLLSPFQIAGILSYVSQYGEMKTIYELREVESLDMNTINQIMPFVTTNPVKDDKSFNLKRALKYGGHDIFLRYSRVLEEQEGYSPIADSVLEESPNRRYLGSPERLYMRYRYQFTNQLSFGFTGDKDAGEEFFSGNNKEGFDFYSAHVFARNIGPVKQLALGDYHAQFGQGLALWSGFSFGKTPNALNAIRYGQKLRPYTSANENLFLRGAAATIELSSSISTTVFYSNKNVDANREGNDTATSDEIVFSSLQASGYHRTPGEMADKSAVNEQIMGGNVSYEKNNFHFGVTGVHYDYDGSFNRNLRLYNKFDLNDAETYNASADLNWIVGKVNFFGEAAVSRNGGWAYISGAQFELDPRLEMVVINRNYQKDYHSVYARAFGESSNNQNERGTYVGGRFKVAPRLNFTGYADFYRHDWLSFRVDAPSIGADYLAQLDYAPNSYVEMYLRYRTESDRRNASSTERPVNVPVDQVKHNFRYDIDYSVSQNLSLGNRVEYTFYQNGDEDPATGFLLFQDVKYNPNKSKWSFWGRMALFDVTGYNARIYAYENDVLYYFSIPAFFDRGFRWYGMLKFEPTRYLDVWAKVGQSYYSNVDEISSGLNQIDQPHKTELRLQIRIRF